MSGLSNYPPGVTGNEYAISGATREWEEERECPICGQTGVMHHETHRDIGVWAWCMDEACPGAKEGFEVWEDEPEYGYQEDDD